MLYAWPAGELEVRAKGGGYSVTGRFPYDDTATLSDGGRTGRPRKERIASRAFAYRVVKPDEDVHLLVGHSYDSPLASKATGTLALRDTAEALTFDARIPPEIAATSYGRDALAMIGAGLAVGISPGFRIPPARTVPDAEDVEEEEDEGPGSENRGAIVRIVRQALLFELSVVAVAAYKNAIAQIEARDWTLGGAELPDTGLRRAYSRWRA
jgi:phage head maturation protease